MFEITIKVAMTAEQVSELMTSEGLSGWAHRAQKLDAARLYHIGMDAEKFVEVGQVVNFSCKRHKSQSRAIVEVENEYGAINRAVLIDFVAGDAVLVNEHGNVYTAPMKNVVAVIHPDNHSCFAAHVCAHFNPYSSSGNPAIFDAVQNAVRSILCGYRELADALGDVELGLQRYDVIGRPIAPQAIYDALAWESEHGFAGFFED